MRRILVGVFLVAALGALFFLLLGRDESENTPAARLASPNSVLYLEFRDIPESMKRWPDTTLSKICLEPTVARFFSRPMGQIPSSWRAAWSTLVRFRPINVYLCCSDWGGKDWVFGARCSGDLRHWQSEIENQIHGLSAHRLVLISSDPQRQAGLSPGAGKLLFAVRSGRWLLFSSHPEALRASLRRIGNKPAGLETSQVFRQCHTHVPPDADFFGFATGQTEGSSGPPLDWLSPASANPAMMLATKLEGPNIHDTVFTPVASGQTRLPAKGMYLTTPDTLAYISLPLDLLHVRELTRRMAREWGIAQTAEQYLNEVTNSGVDFHHLSEIVKGIEIVINRNPNQDLFDGVFLLQVSDPDSFVGMMRKILQQEFPKRWTEGYIGDSRVFQFAAGQSINLVFGMNGNYFIAARNGEAYAEARARLQNQQVGLNAPSNYKILDTTQPSAVQFYLDANTLFERGYGSIRPMLVFGAALVPNLGDFIDPDALPETSEICKHLTPILMCRRELPDGTLDDSVGPLTALEASALGVGAAASLSFIER
ncbi:MAG TPA: hypothetical protein VHS80_02465 [Chthoniobacterales bacterium]|nr:hypothetical protein [Chthoniobacterales bacterium]